MTATRRGPPGPASRRPRRPPETGWAGGGCRSCGWERGAARRGGASERGAGAGRRRHGSRPAHLGVGLQRAHLAHARPASARRTEIGRHRVVCSGHLGFKKKRLNRPSCRAAKPSTAGPVPRACATTPTRAVPAGQARRGLRHTAPPAPLPLPPFPPST